MAKRTRRGQGLASGLKGLVKVVEATLGQVVTAVEGRGLYDAVEAVRLDMVAVREGDARALSRARKRLGRLSLRERTALARAYTVYLELVNVCENAYRTHRLRERTRAARTSTEKTASANVVFVLTAHPTESRSPTNIRLMRRVQTLLIEGLERRDPPDTAQLAHLLHLVWRTGTHPAHKPTVEDEALHLFSLLDDPILEELLHLRREGHVVRLRTWVGGDKDGHPGVGPEQTDKSLNLSRARLLELVEGRVLPEVEEDVRLLPVAGVQHAWDQLRTRVEHLRSVTIGDGRRVALLQRALARLAAEYERRRGHAHPRLDDLQVLLDQFPGLVVPLELREERGLFQRHDTIAGMLRFLRGVARGGRVDWYVRGCIVSMTDRAEDLWEAHKLVRDILDRTTIPIVPLFEMPDVLPRATGILERTLTDGDFAKLVREQHGSLEVMLGYSDTSKRMGVLASRLAIHDAMKAIGAWAEAHDLTVCFFHGSGGSVGRGGGTIADRAATWPAGAMDVVKQTLQGEMVERTLATPEILRSQVLKIADVQAAPPRFKAASAAAQDLSARTQRAFVDLVGATRFLDLLRVATPYTRLGALNIGSRPEKRRAGATAAGLEQLRAIPWVLCWTQTRYLLHAWIGVGTAWREVRDDKPARARLLKALERDPLLRSYLRMLRFTLAKTVPAIWQEYVRALAGTAPPLVKRLEQEWEDALDLARQVSPNTELLSDRPWLRESIYYRSPMIHPLNLIQIEVLTHPRLSAAQELLFRETVTGIAAGMLTTG
jgi:phosphoenolpyruvate carboxylase